MLRPFLFVLHLLLTYWYSYLFAFPFLSSFSPFLSLVFTPRLLLSNLEFFPLFYLKACRNDNSCFLFFISSLYLSLFTCTPPRDPYYSLCTRSTLFHPPYVTHTWIDTYRMTQFRVFTIQPEVVVFYSFFTISAVFNPEADVIVRDHASELIPEFLRWNDVDTL